MSLSVFGRGQAGKRVDGENISSSSFIFSRLFFFFFFFFRILILMAFSRDVMVEDDLAPFLLVCEGWLYSCGVDQGLSCGRQHLM